MEQIKLDLVSRARQLAIVTETRILCSQYDNDSKTLIFSRPPEYEQDNLLLLFRDAYQSYAPISLGVTNSFLIPGLLTKTLQLDIQIAFERDKKILIHSDIMVFQLRPSLKTKEPDPVPLAYLELTRRAFAGVQISDNKLLFQNTTGDEVVSVSLPEGGAGGISKEYVDEHNIRTLAAAKKYTDDHSGGATTEISPATPVNGFVWGTELTTGQDNKITEIKGSGTFYDRNIMIFGDSITAGNFWSNRFSELMAAAHVDTTAVGGAKWCDSSTTVLDGNPIISVMENNVIANQVQKVINNIGSYKIPELIIFYAGVNDSYGTMIHTADNMDQYYVNAGEYIPLNSLDRKNLASAIRWSVETMRKVYPFAHVILVTPYQTAVGWTSYSTIKSTRDVIIESALRLGAPFVDLFHTSGIYGALETKNAVGRYLKDGLHPGTEGARMIASRIFDVVKGLSFPYREIGQKINSATNAKFESGTTGWAPIGSVALAASEGALTITPTATFNSFIIQSRLEVLNYIVGHKYYVRIMVKSDLINSAEFKSRYIAVNAAGSAMTGTKTTKTADWSMVSGVVQAAADSNRLSIVFIFTAATTTPRGQKIQCKEPMIVDLTTLYGAGDEPTAAYLDERISFFTDTSV